MEIALPARLRRRQPLTGFSIAPAPRPRALIALLAAALIGGAVLWIAVIRGGSPHRPTPPPRPVAVLSAGGSATAVTATGTVLGAADLSGSLPRIEVTRKPVAGARLTNGRLRADLRVLGAAPAPLLGLVGRIYRGPHGLTVRMANGLLAYFGDSARPRAKWDSFAAVIASPAAAGAAYIDLRLPERPAVGMPPGSQSAEEAAEPAQAGTAESTSAALAESLAKAIHGESPIAPAGTEAEEPPPPALATESESAEVSTPESAVQRGG